MNASTPPNVHGYIRHSANPQRVESSIEKAMFQTKVLVALDYVSSLCSKHKISPRSIKPTALGASVANFDVATFFLSISSILI